jgi:hypothetical protein
VGIIMLTSKGCIFVFAHMYSPYRDHTNNV